MNMTERGFKTGLAKFIWVGLVLFGIVVLNYIVARSTIRVDLTSDQRYTLADTSARMAAELPGHVEIEAFFSAELPAQLEQMKRDINDLLSEYVAYSDGKLSYVFIDPCADCEEATVRASALGVPSFPLEEHSESELSVRYVYAGIALTYDDGDEEHVEVIQQILPGMNYEYEITRNLRAVVSDEGPATVGFLYGDGGMFDAFVNQPINPQQPTDPSEMIEQLEVQLNTLFEELFTIELVDINAGPIPDHISGLFVIGPTEPWDEDMQYRLDQYIMGGHPVAMFISPYRMESPEFNQPGLPPIIIPSMNDTGLDGLLDAYGIRLNQDAIFETDDGSMQVSAERREGRMMGYQVQSWVPYSDPRLPVITDISEESVLVPNMNLIAFFPQDRANPLSQSSLSETAQLVEAREQGEVRVIDVLRTSERSYRYIGDDENRYSTLRERDLAPYRPTEAEPEPEIDLDQGPFTIAMTLEGFLESAFPDRASDDPEAEDAHRASVDEGRIFVVANGYWVHAVLLGNDPLLGGGTMRMLPPSVRAVVNNYRISSIILFRNTADWLAQDADLVNIRARGRSTYIETANIDDADKRFYRLFNIAGVPAIFCFLGLCGFLRRQYRRNLITEKYSGEGNQA
jgi:ABC-type uncharacterized transport system involved in gliding motility auxiliary subunit